MVTTRSLADAVRNVLDFLQEADLCLVSNQVLENGDQVSWHSYDRNASFLLTRSELTLKQYLHWLNSGSYSTVLFDGSLIQMSYAVTANSIVGHRLAYIPCPYRISGYAQSLLNEGLPLADIVEMLSEDDSVEALFRSPIRFDFDPSVSRAGHPATHFTINTADCRIACVAPFNVKRFIDFVFRNFYPEYWIMHRSFFESGLRSRFAEKSITADEVTSPHIMWAIG